jgi:hypothetical protein
MTIVHAGTTAMLRTALISVTCTLLVMSVFIFIAGIVCGYYISQRRRASAVTNKQSESQNVPKDMEPELELKENAAYITIRPRTWFSQSWKQNLIVTLWLFAVFSNNPIYIHEHQILLFFLSLCCHKSMQYHLCIQCFTMHEPTCNKARSIVCTSVMNPVSDCVITTTLTT